MVRCLLVCLFLVLPALVAAEDRLDPLEATVRQLEQVQPGLESYSADIKTENPDRLIEKISPARPQPEAIPAGTTLAWYWLRDKGGLIASMDRQSIDFRQKAASHMAALFSAGSESSLIPAGQKQARRNLARQASIKTTDTLLGETRLKRIELSFSQPATLQGAFYTHNLHLPQDMIRNLYFDIDAKTQTVQEIGILTADGLKLTTEIRYHEVLAGFLPERIKITSPDGSIDDRLEITYGDIDRFSLPTRIAWIVRHPERQEDIAADFAGHRVNQPFPDAIRTEFELLQQP